MSFCQFGGHNTGNTRKQELLHTIPYFDPDKNATLFYQICSECMKYLTGDPTMLILLSWANEWIQTSKLPKSLNRNPLKQSLVVQHVDKFLNLNMRVKLGNRFPFFLLDDNESEKQYFKQELEKNSVLSSIFMPDLKNSTKRSCIALKLWVGATFGAKATRATFNVLGGKQEYDVRLRTREFQAAEQYAIQDNIVKYGVQIAPIVELIVRNHTTISLEGSQPSASIWRYIKKIDRSTLENITENDLQIISC
jgi:hypothetical protein